MPVVFIAVDQVDLSPPVAVVRRRALRLHLWLPLGVAAVVAVLLSQFGGDLWIAQHIHAWGGGSWLLREHVVTATIIHPGGKYLSLLLWLLVLTCYLRSGRDQPLANWRQPLKYLLLVTLLSTLTVTVLKAVIDMDCAWDIIGLGGQRPYLGLFDARPPSLPAAGCFPAGHASAGYCWVALYFNFAATKPRWRHRGLAFGLLLGAIFGISQQLRGAHFASHDVASLLICWLIALALDAVMLRGQRTVPT